MIKSLRYAGLFFLLFTLCSASEYYHYVDEQGVRHFTQNYGDIPQRYRPQVNVHESIETPRPAPEQKEKSISPEDLVVKKDELDKIYAKILTKREQLVQKRDKMGQIEYNKAAEQLNQEIRDYQEKSRAYEKEVEQYNRQISLTPGGEKPDN